MSGPDRPKPHQARLTSPNPQTRRRAGSPGVDFSRIASAALARSEAIVKGLLPEGHREGSEWVARNPRRPDQSAGSFKVSLIKGAWADFATDDHGKDLVSLAAFITGRTQAQAAIELAKTLGVDPFR